MALYLGKDEVNLFSGARINSDNILLQEKKVTPSESQVEVIADSDHSGLSKVTVEPISKTYIGSNIIKKTSATYTPGTQNQVIDAGQYLAENQIIAGDTNLVSGNIRSGVSIFGVSGNTNVVDTSSGNATSGQILNGYKAWVDGKEISGNITTKTTSDLTVTNATVKIPAGYYASEISKSVTTTTIATPNVSINGANGLITATNTQSAGYVSAGSKSGEL